MIPRPRKMKLTEGTASSEVPVKERLCPQLGVEEYRIYISPKQIWLDGSGKTGFFYARTTLEQLRMIYGEDLPCMEIEDGPAYSYRSFQIDCARHYFSVDELKKMIRMSAEFKLNHFHWHISDDQGWRIESKCYPRLHEIGSVRAGDHFGNYHSDQKSGGYYTRDEVRDIVDYCKELGIEVVPEIDMPGHVTAILAAYPNLSCLGQPVEVGMKAGIFKELFCAGREETFTFIEKLLDDLMELFPGKYFHIGGDEAPKERWNGCENCQKRMKEEGLKNAQELQGYFCNRIASYLQSKGRIPIVWNEAVYGGNLDKGVVVQLWTEDKDNQIQAHLYKGGTAILAMVENCYCDYPYGMHSLKDMYDLETAPAEFGEHGEASVLGMECLVWTEFIRDNERLEELCWPRFAALAEVGWCKKECLGYEDFRERLTKLFALFEKYGVHATKLEGWDPDDETAEKQTKEFQMNFSKEDREEARRAQNDI
ncbi:beta-N-acetylhexosaminidase [Sporofaciens musculi]|jgi:hexosaminidase|uniref:beta-N-acetylhexosaminidase n=1 Tax=Sporofaciens musculi TaxID=2681861 RepID=UPI0025A2064D|nr:beta-N-acetylhexosaminidase [Sporofaciens musculi]